ncbi:Gfo/Idh/MocA family oxidoreductase [Saccharothrix violaceirubra]|uniref:Putative dehydrogenase n=1 Tax=Saccharothrix violaceirubra TaxID=413306 RepID=A0A7W7T9W0_9PSEU|nr:Gfo/Idh/MocA family oxidoreductase [Saccharothrix violaceirubra]MBB4969146.1 putative dehydrogenase [Saccharothrix violaceirubra]
MSARPKVALIGAGMMGSLHARVLSQSDRVDFALLVEQREEVGKEIADRYDAAYSPSIDDLAGIDAVVIAAATEAHYDIAKQVLALGKPLLVEKPLAATYAQSEELVRESQARGLPLVCGFLERFNPAILTARQFVGDVVQINAMRHSPFVPRIKTGVAGDLLIHDVDLAIRFIGDTPKAIKGSFGYFNEQSVENRSEDSADATMSFEKGALATISASRISQRKIRQISVLELDRLIEIDLLRRDITIYRHVADSPAADGVGYKQQTVIELPTILQSAEPLAAQLNHFLNLLELGAGSDEVLAERTAILPAHRVVHEATVSAGNAS